MEIIQFVRAIARRWWLLLIGSALGLAVAYGITTTSHRQYESTVTLQLNPSARSAFLPFGSESVSSAPVAGLAASYSEILRSRSFGQVVVEQLDLNVRPEVIGRSVTARLIPSTDILRLTIVWDTPRDAESLVQRIAEIFITENLRRQQNQPGAGSELSSLERIAATYPARMEALRQQRDRLDQAVGRGDLSRLTELNSLDSRLASLESTYASLLSSIQQGRGRLDTASILDSASPAQPVGPPGLARALPFGLIAGLAIAIALAMFLDSLDDTLRTPADLANGIGSGPMAVIGRVRTRGWTSDARRSRLVTVHASRSGPAEAFRTLRANLRFLSMEQPLRTLVVTSASANEGKTLVASNLAVAFAQSGDRVLMIDADLRRPSLHDAFGVRLAPGFGELLAHRESLPHYADPSREPATAASFTEAPTATADTGPSAKHGNAKEADTRTTGREGAPGPEFLEGIPGVLSSGTENLWLMTAGATVRDPTRLLDSRVLPRLLEELKERWDVIIFDTAPVGPVADTLALAARTDATLLVARADRTRRGQMESTIESLQKTGKPTIGVVFNDYSPDLFSRYTPYASYYHYYGYHGYGSDDGSTSASPNGHTPAAVNAPGGASKSSGA